MENNVTHIERIETSGAQQLTLLSVPDTSPAQLQSSRALSRFHLSKATRQRGLAHVAEIRRQLAESQAQREAAQVTRLPSRHSTAA